MLDALDLAKRFDESADWLLDGKPYPEGRGVGALQFRQAAELIRAAAEVVEKNPGVQHVQRLADYFAGEKTSSKRAG